MNLESRLKLVAKRIPELAPLALSLLKEGISSIWYKRYLKLNIKHARKTVLIQSYLGKPELISDPKEQYGSDAAMARLFDTILARNPDIIDLPLHQWDIPKSCIPFAVGRTLSHYSRSSPYILRDWLFSDKLPEKYISHPIMRRLQSHCRFDEHSANAYFKYKHRYHNKVFHRYFDSENPLYWVPNVLHFLYYFLRYFFSTEKKELPQRKIPIAVARQLKTGTMNIPGLLAAIDLLYLGAMGALDIEQVNRVHPDFEILIRTLERDEFEYVRDAFSILGYLTPTEAIRLRNRLDRRKLLSMHLTSYLFNMKHLLLHKKKEPIWALYQYVNIEKYNQLAAHHFAQYDDRAAERISYMLIMDPSINKGLELRSHINIAIFIDALMNKHLLEVGEITDFNYMKALPEVAQYQFGITEIKPGDRKRKKKTSKKSLKTRSSKSLGEIRAFRNQNLYLEELYGYDKE